jgi:hypothetical protein
MIVLVNYGPWLTAGVVLYSEWSPSPYVFQGVMLLDKVRYVPRRDTCVTLRRMSYPRCVLQLSPLLRDTEVCERDSSEHVLECKRNA